MERMPDRNEGKIGQGKRFEDKWRRSVTNSQKLKSKQLLTGNQKGSLNESHDLKKNDHQRRRLIKNQSRRLFDNQKQSVDEGQGVDWQPEKETEDNARQVRRKKVSQRLSLSGNHWRRLDDHQQ